MYNLPLSQHLKPSNLSQEPLKESLSARRPTNQTIGSASPLPTNKLKNPSSASKITYISDYKGAPFSKDELETEIKEHIKALKEMRSELGKQKSLILSHLETSDGSKSAAAGSQSAKHSFGKETRKTAGSASATHAQGIERSFLGYDGIKKANESSPRKGDFTRSYEKLKTEPSEVRKSHKLDQVYSQLMEDKHYFDYKKLKGRTGSRDGAANFFGEAPTRSSGLFTQLAPTSIVPNKSQESSPKTYQQKSLNNPYLSKASDTSPSFIKLYSGASQIPPTYLKDESPFQTSSASILGKHALTNVSPQRYSAQNKVSSRAQRSKELLDKILPSKTFLPPTQTYQRERDESQTIYSKNTETEISLRSRNPDEEERPRKAHARHILVEDSDQVNIQKTEEAEGEEEEEEANPSSPFRIQEEKRIMEYQSIIAELQERIRALETEKTMIAENEISNEKIAYHSTTSQNLLEQQVADLKDQLNEQEVAQNSVLGQLRDRISQLEQENENFIETTQHKDQQIQQLKEDLQENDTQAQDLQKTVAKLSAQVKSLQNEKEDNSEQSDKLTNSLNELKRANSLADQSNEEMVSKYNQLEKDHSELQQTLQEKSSELNKYQRLSDQINQLLGTQQGDTIHQIHTTLEKSKSLEGLLAQEKQQFSDFKSENEHTIQNLKSRIHEINQEKESLVSQINSVLHQSDTSTITDENLKQIITEINQNKAELSQFKTQEEFIKTKIQELSKKNQDLLHQVETQQEKLKEAEKHTQDFQNSQIKTLQDKISQLENQNSTQNNVDENTKNIIEALQEKNELYQIQTQNLEGQNAALLGQLTALKNSLQLIQEEKDAHHSELKNLQAEKAQLQENIDKTENLLKKANNELKELKNSISAAAKENQKLQHHFDENQNLLKNLKTEKEQEALQQANKFQQEIQSLQNQIKSLQDENEKLQSTLQSTIELKQALDDLNQERDQANQKVTTLEEDLASKDRQIEALKYDLTQIKGFLFQRQSESSFDDQRSENRLNLQSENSFSQDISNSFRELSEWETGGALKSKSFKIKTKPQGDESNKSTEYIKANPKLKHQSFSMKIKKPKDEDPVRSSYEKIIRELNEKIANNEKNYKKEISLRVVEANKQHIEREEQLQAEIDNLQQEKNNLLKKIEDIEWDKAYEHTKKESKPSSIKMDDTPSAHANVDSEAKKKKKKKKKTKANDPDEN